MKQVRPIALVERLRLLSLALAAGCLAVGYAWGGRWTGALLFLALGIAGWLLPKPLGRPLGSPLLVIFTAAAGLGAVNDLPSLGMLPAVIAALAYWDLDAFRERLKRVPPSEATRKLEKLHLQRLAWVLALGLAISLPGLLLRFKISLLWAVLLSLLIVIGIRRGIGSISNRQRP